jgi:glycosyltransferase involved in cell wall biosynthesis
MTNKGELIHKRILLCPVEIGVNMQLIVEELRRRGYDATSASGLYASSNPLGFVNDIKINSFHARGRLKRHCSNIAFAIWAAINHDIFHFFFGHSLYYNRFTRHLDLRLLRKLGKIIIVHFRGSDVIGSRYFSYLRDKAADKDTDVPPISDPKQERMIKTWRRYAHRMLVSWPLLLDAVHDSVMVRQAINLDYWRAGKARPESSEDGIIRIVHAPTKRHKKGTDFVVSAVTELKRAGYPVELVLVQNMPHKKVKQVYQRCDIGVDQLILGWYGNYSIELMSLGKPVICYINPKWKNNSEDLPVVSAGPKELKEKLKMLIANPQLRQDLGKRGRGYVKRHHDVKVVVDQCLNIYEECF